MKIVPACAPCILKRVLATAQRITDDPWLHDKVISQVMGEWIEAERGVTPAERMNDLHDLVCKNLGVTDPWQKVREGWVGEVEPLLEALRKQVESAPDRFEAALRAAARANVFDDELLGKKKVRDELRRIGLRHPEAAAENQFSVSDLDRFRTEFAGAKTLMLIHDSAPELPFDRVLIEELVRERAAAGGEPLEVTSVVRSQPVILDATRADLEESGIDQLEAVTAVVDPGVPGIGISIEAVGREFRERFEAADLVIAKGQAHLETLDGVERPVYHLFRIKCGVVAREEGGKIGEIVFSRRG